MLLLGATAAKALLGQPFRLTESRGRPIASDLAELVVATIHPSAILRAGRSARPSPTICGWSPSTRGSALP